VSDENDGSFQETDTASSQNTDTAPWETDDPEWPVRNSETQLSNPWFDAGRDRVVRPSGEDGDYYWIEPSDAVVTVAHDREAEELVMVEQYRPRFRRRFVSCPGGGVEDDESPEEGGRRELREETGYRAGRLEHLGSYHPSGFDRFTRHVCYATDLEAGEHDRDAQEEITVVRRGVEDAITATLSGINTGWTVTPLLWAREEGLL
jgi:ADP-ribose pyrophosphatase